MTASLVESSRKAIGSSVRGAAHAAGPLPRNASRRAASSNDKMAPATGSSA